MAEEALYKINVLNANNFRDLRTNIEYQLQHKKDKFVVVTSSNQGEGKSYCALNVALAFSEAKKKVLLVDLDLHRPRLSKNLSYSYVGIVSIYEEAHDYRDCLTSIAENVDFLPSGYVPLNPSEIISSDIVSNTLHQAAKEYDIIIIDSPPVRLSPDTKFIISEFKNVLFIVRANKTRNHEVEEAFDKMKLINPSILGTVLNMKKFSKKERMLYEYK
ncbi:CpsD/CapB family tyrosine-protein kinase [Listeria newyorkensis]|uniref:non-specific protein-tyrosine kinase n=1 Tax=Listeria newyorkensis TaxID=1497681 RepID=A0A841YWL6_9LIST|nr:CpsD/CapB family tyrosine-protein kinase [Listeria newyorkensis]MBC1457705.1 CpsD/CapB family tyrosine-protein kinase [Listeria newyorkensis]